MPLKAHYAGVCHECGYQGRVYPIAGFVVCWEHLHLKKYKAAERALQNDLTKK